MRLRRLLLRYRFSVSLLLGFCLPFNHFLVATASEGVECSVHGTMCSCPLICASRARINDSAERMDESCHHASASHQIGMHSHSVEARASSEHGCFLKAGCQPEKGQILPNAHLFLAESLVNWIVEPVPHECVTPFRIEVLKGYSTLPFHPPKPESSRSSTVEHNKIFV